jgi:hypothetical protein
MGMNSQVLGLIGLCVIGAGVWAWYRLRIFHMAGTVLTPSMWFYTRRITIRAEDIETQLAEIVAMAGMDRALALLELLAQCEEPDSGMAAQILKALFDRQLSAEATRKLARLIKLKESWLAEWVASAVFMATLKESPAFGGGADARMFEMLAARLPHFIAADITAASLATALIALDRERGMAWVAAHLDFEKKQFTDLLNLLTREGWVIAPEKVEDWLRRDEMARLKEPRGSKLRKVGLLNALGLSRLEAAEPKLREIAALPDFPASSAAEVLLDLYHLPHPRGSLMDWGDEDGIASLSNAERVTYLVDRFGYAVELRGAHVILEDLGHVLPQVAEALRLAGLPRGAKLVEKMESLLPQEGLPHDAKARSDFLKGDETDLEGQVVGLMEAHDHGGEDYWLGALRYELAHKDGFRRV